MNTETYVNNIVRAISERANPADAEPMKKYMKNLFEYYGIKTPERREITKPYLEKSLLPPLSGLERIVKKLWKKPQRELQYFAQSLVQKYVKQMDESYIYLFEFMIVNKSWWDTVDFIAANLVGPFFKKHPDLIGLKIAEWMDSENIWLQRTCLLYQLKYKQRTDNKLLFQLIKDLRTSKEFFIRKAIGWSLREYSKTDPKSVLNFVDSVELSNLSKREALRLLK